MSTTIRAQPSVHNLLQRLHSLSVSQESSIRQKTFYLTRYLRFLLFKESWSSASDNHMKDKLVALDQDKCEFMYLLCRSMGVKNAVEAGTSHGISTIYLALAVGQNVEVARRETGDSGIEGRVIGTEKEHEKAEKARGHWKEAGNEVEPWIELREGDLLETLKVEKGMPKEVDLLLLDIWTPLALPTLKIITPRLRRGAIILTDNTTMAASLYGEYLNYVRDPVNGFQTRTLPFKGGLEMSVYLPGE